MINDKQIPLTWFAIYADAERQTIEILLNQLCDDPIMQMHWLEIRQNEDAGESTTDEDAFLFYRSILYFTPTSDKVRIEDQMVLSKHVKSLLDEKQIPSEIVSAFEHLLQ